MLFLPNVILIIYERAQNHVVLIDLCLIFIYLYVTFISQCIYRTRQDTQVFIYRIFPSEKILLYKDDEELFYLENKTLSQDDRCFPIK
jgi:hypothetical protein